MLTATSELKGLIRSPDSLRAALHSNLIDFEPCRLATSPILTRIVPQRVGEIRLINFTGNPLSGVRSERQVAREGCAYIGVLYQRAGRTLSSQDDQRAEVAAGDIAVWHSMRPMSFDMPERFHKVCMVVPATRFEAVLPNVETYRGLHFKAGTRLARLLGAYLSELADEREDEDRPSADETTMNMTLELLSAALQGEQRAELTQARTTLFARILRFVDHRLHDPILSPSIIAEAHGISIRYLYLLFSERGETVSGWVRARRLARCRADILNQTAVASITEIAFRWGFSDSAHFSRLFRRRYGMAPRDLRRLGAEGHPLSGRVEKFEDRSSAVARLTGRMKA